MKIVLSESYKQSLREYTARTLEEFGTFQVKKVFDRLKEIEKRISKFPDAYPLEQSLLKEDGIFRCATLFKHQEVVYWVIDEDTCMLITIWDTRRNPQSLRNIAENVK